MKDSINKNKGYIFLFIAFLIYSFSLLFSKLASLASNNTNFIIYYLISFALLALYAMLWQVSLKHLPLTIAYSLKSLTIIINMIIAMLILKEKINTNMIIGSLFIIIGAFIIGKDS